MAFDITAVTEIHNDRVDGAIKALVEAGDALLAASTLDGAHVYVRECAEDTYQTAATLADAFNHPMTGDILARISALRTA